MKKPRGKQKQMPVRKKAAPWKPGRDGQQRTVSKRSFVGTGLTVVVALLVAVASLVYIALLFVYVVLPSDLVPNINDQRALAFGDRSQYFEQAKMQIFKEQRELGAMRVSEERTAEFYLRNVGGKPLEISRVQSSCMCTSAGVIIDDEKSPIFTMGMHNAPAVQNWRGIVEPGLTATIRVIYKPSLMQDQGSVARTVTLSTNDPSRPVVELSVHATVQ